MESRVDRHAGRRRPRQGCGIADVPVDHSADRPGVCAGQSATRRSALGEPLEKITSTTGPVAGSSNTERVTCE